ncbi:MAG TPA: type II toxin-antitoxin system RelE/ParE family toxin [Terriglobales bacterium]|nr:type II toxin-antitoxin system RelE/ParE family toxin [Terriglobales bacterium]
MKKFRLVLSDAAVADILEQADWYAARSGEILGKRWEMAVATAILRVVNRPDAGPLCAFEASELSDVRRAAVPRFPKHLVFYRFDDREIFILRVIHGARDLERLL